MEAPKPAALFVVLADKAGELTAFRAVEQEPVPAADGAAQTSLAAHPIVQINTPALDRHHSLSPFRLVPLLGLLLLC